jgi:membrane protease YdiL (CAAX protease family)
MAGVVLVYLGISLQQGPLEDLIGSLWTGWRSALRDVGIATGFWVVARLASWLIHYLVPSYTPPWSILHSRAALLISIFAAIAAGVAEELVFRGYLQKQFTALCRNAGAGLTIQAILFALFHGYNQVLPTFVQHFSFGLMAGIIAHWRKSLLPGMIGHAWLDAYWDVLRIVRLR